MAEIESISSQTFTDELGYLYFDVKVKRTDGSEEEKRLSLEDYLILFQEGTKKTTDYREVVKLPKEVSWAAQGENRDDFKAVVMLPEKVRPVFYMGQIIPDVPFPALCAYVEAKNGERARTRLFAVKELGMDAELFRYPFGNVSSIDGNCCFGNIHVTGLRDAGDALKILNAFLEGETNGDLFGGNVAGYLNQADIYEDLRGKKKFPKRLLIGTGIKVRELCRANEKIK